mgnify:CR=1 FL=1
MIDDELKMSFIKFNRTSSDVLTIRRIVDLEKENESITNKLNELIAIGTMNDEPIHITDFINRLNKGEFHDITTLQSLYMHNKHFNTAIST